MSVVAFSAWYVLVYSSCTFFILTTSRFTVEAALPDGDARTQRLPGAPDSRTSSPVFLALPCCFFCAELYQSYCLYQHALMSRCTLHKKSLSNTHESNLSARGQTRS